MSLFKLIGFAPDLDRTTEGALMQCDNLVPSVRGMQGAPSPANTGLAALTATATGAAVMRKLDYTSRFFAGTVSDLYEATSATAWTNVGSALGAASADFPWRFSQFGDTSLAINAAQTLMASAAVGTAFSAITAGPVGAIIETVNQFVFAFDTALGDDYWQCSALGDPTDWAASVVTQAAQGRITSAPGRITAGKRLGDNIVAYKKTALYVGTYVGPADNTWAFQEVPGEIGTASQESVISTGYAHFFVDGNYQDFWVFDGSRPVSIGERVREWFINRLDKQYASRIRGLHDRRNARIYWYYPVKGGVGTLTAALVFNYKTRQWGTDDREIEVPVEYISAGVTYDSAATLYATYDDLPSLPYDSPFWTSNSQVPAIFNTSHAVQTMDGASVSSGFLTYDVGNDIDYLLLRRVKPRYLTKPATAAMKNYYAHDLGDTFTDGRLILQQNDRFDLLRAARWHRLEFDFTGDVELNALDMDFVKEGME